jgi:hypothetical protein
MARFVTESHMRHHPSADENDAQQNHVKYSAHLFILYNKIIFRLFLIYLMLNQFHKKFLKNI